MYKRKIYTFNDKYNYVHNVKYNIQHQISDGGINLKISKRCLFPLGFPQRYNKIQAGKTT